MWVYFTISRKPETNTLESLLDVHTGDEGDPVVKHKLRPYTVAGKKDWRLFLKVEDVKASEIRLVFALVVSMTLCNVSQ